MAVFLASHVTLCCMKNLVMGAVSISHFSLSNRVTNQPKKIQLMQYFGDCIAKILLFLPVSMDMPFLTAVKNMAMTKKKDMKGQHNKMAKQFYVNIQQLREKSQYQEGM